MFSLLFYFSCRPTSQGINVDATTTGIVAKGDQVTITDNNKTRVINNASSKSYSEIYSNTNINTTYIFFVTDGGGHKLSFRVTYTITGTDQQTGLTTYTVGFGTKGCSFTDKNISDDLSK
jgi:hypothetical protein